MKNVLKCMALVSAAALAGSSGMAAKHSKPKPPPKIAKGNVKAGKALFLKRYPMECKGCHKFGKQGSSPLGPDLAHAGKKLNAAKIKLVLKNPKKVYPKTFMPPVKGTDKQLTDIAAFLATQK